MMNFTSWESEIVHSGIKGMHWGIRRYQNEDGTLTEEGKIRYGKRPKLTQTIHNFVVNDKLANLNADRKVTNAKHVNSMYNLWDASAKAQDMMAEAYKKGINDEQLLKDKKFKKVSAAYSKAWNSGLKAYNKLNEIDKEIAKWSNTKNDLVNSVISQHYNVKSYNRTYYNSIFDDYLIPYNTQKVKISK